MFQPNTTAKCRVVKKVTDQHTFLCMKPAEVALILNTAEPMALCLDCAKSVAQEIAESVPGGRRDRVRSRATQTSPASPLLFAAELVTKERDNLTDSAPRSVLSRLDAVVVELSNIEASL